MGRKKCGSLGIFIEKDPAAWSNWVPSGDPYGIRTHVTAVKGRCLNRLTKGPYDGSGGQIRTNDLPGMNRPL